MINMKTDKVFKDMFFETWTKGISKVKRNYWKLNFFKSFYYE